MELLLLLLLRLLLLLLLLLLLSLLNQQRRERQKQQQNGNQMFSHRLYVLFCIRMVLTYVQSTFQLKQADRLLQATAGLGACPGFQDDCGVCFCKYWPAQIAGMWEKCRKKI